MPGTPASSSITGLRLVLLYGANQNVSGLDLGLVTQTTGDQFGVQWGPVHIVEGNFTGWQMGAVNLVKGYFVGLQYGIANITNGGVHGVQFGQPQQAFLDNAGQLRGVIGDEMSRPWAPHGRPARSRGSRHGPAGGARGSSRPRSSWPAAHAEWPSQRGLFTPKPSVESRIRTGSLRNCRTVVDRGGSGEISCARAPERPPGASPP